MKRPFLEDSSIEGLAINAARFRSGAFKDDQIIKALSSLMD
jgi:hypothetical protein